MNRTPGIVSVLLLLCACSSLTLSANEQDSRRQILRPELLSIKAIRDFAASVNSEFQHEYDREPINGIKGEVVSFTVDQLKQFALVLTPAGATPATGWPVLIFNHGHHPSPPDYGRVNGVTDRPGNYYRQVPIAFARQGFLVVVPDFRGHNDSQGLEFTHGLLEAYWYTRDSIATFKALPSLPAADTSNVFMWGHSMGGEVTLRALLALGSSIQGASIWSASSGSAWEKAMHFSLGINATEDELHTEKPAIIQLQNDIDELPFAFDPESGNPVNYLSELQVPLSVHHSIGDIKSTPFSNSVALVTRLYLAGKPYRFFSYAGDEHLFSDERFALAIERDVSFFKDLTVAETNNNHSGD